MNENRLKLNDTKTEFIILGSKYILTHVSTTYLQVCEECVSETTVVCNIGAFFDSEMTMSTHVRSMCKGPS